MDGAYFRSIKPGMKPGPENKTSLQNSLVSGNFAQKAGSMDELTNRSPPAAEKPAMLGETPPRPPVPRIGEDGKPVYDQQFFLALARCGKDVWNEWREKHSSKDRETYIRVTFADVGCRASENLTANFFRRAFRRWRWGRRSSAPCACSSSRWRCATISG
jgi:hypothetical protein